MLTVSLGDIIQGIENDDTAVHYAIGPSDTVAPGTGIDLEFDADVQTMSPEASEYKTCYVTSHKGPCRVATYNRDGQLIATGSADASIKILDTERMLAKSAMPVEVMMNETAQQNMENHAVIPTLYDDVDEVTTAESRNLLSLGHNNIVHSPTNPGFVTCSNDFGARFWYQRSTTD
ncbi:hypothetical protein J1605_009588 [Eschrichtius robustus]|uniref:Cleavage stimulation factor 50 kDa subunit n=1 Tax=Eschrichtius robustus TaxID=9764 RepID=A0AB34GWH9_ESCRO|nr:hypothetical protein J1605_009588 [Eschrichtius robustus]